MAATKILKEDLDIDLQQLAQQVSDSKGASETLPIRLDKIEDSIGTIDSGTDVATMIGDLDKKIGTIDPETDVATMIGELDRSIGDIDPATDVSTLIGDLDDEVKSAKSSISLINEEGNFNEVYEYDTYGNVTKQTVTGDKAYTVDYVYADAANGILNYSEKIYVAGSETVAIKKTYTYDAATGNITGVATVTTRTPITP